MQLPRVLSPTSLRERREVCVRMMWGGLGIAQSRERFDMLPRGNYVPLYLAHVFRVPERMKM